jgi:hypothetical protein
MDNNNIFFSEKAYKRLVKLLETHQKRTDKTLHLLKSPDVSEISREVVTDLIYEICYSSNCLLEFIISYEELTEEEKITNLFWEIMEKNCKEEDKKNQE